MGKDTKEYFLMHKNIKVCLMEISDDGVLGSVRHNEAAADHFPLGGRMNNMKFHDWWKDRAIPKTTTRLTRLKINSFLPINLVSFFAFF